MNFLLYCFLDVIKIGSNAGEPDKARSAKAEARVLKLQEEAEIRLKVDAIQRRLSLVLRALGAVAVANPLFAHEQLPLLVGLRSHLYKLDML